MYMYMYVYVQIFGSNLIVAGLALSSEDESKLRPGGARAGRGGSWSEEEWVPKEEEEEEEGEEFEEGDFGQWSVTACVSGDSVLVSSPDLECLDGCVAG